MKVTMRNEIATVELTALTAATDTDILWPENDQKMTLVINASAVTELTVKAGNGIQGAADLKLNVPKGISLIKLESGRFKNVSGDKKGKIVIKSTGTPSVGVVALV